MTTGVMPALRGPTDLLAPAVSSDASDNPFRFAQQQLVEAAAILKLEPALHELLRWPLRELHVTLPVKVDWQLTMDSIGSSLALLTCLQSANLFALDEVHPVSDDSGTV